MSGIIKTIALRFGDGFAPSGGTIKAHQNIINKLGFVWYGKIGGNISKKAEIMIFNNIQPRILLIHSGTPYRYWAYVDALIHKEPPQDEYPSYYQDKSNKIKVWFRVVKFEKAPSDVMSTAIVMSSKATLGVTSKHSMSPYFMIEYEGDNDK